MQPINVAVNQDETQSTVLVAPSEVSNTSASNGELPQGTPITPMPPPPTYALGKAYKPITTGKFSDEVNRLVYWDIGSDRTLIDMKTAKELKLPLRQPPEPEPLAWLDKVVSYVKAHTDVRVTFGKHTYEITDVRVVESIPSRTALLLGRDFMQSTMAYFDIFCGYAIFHTIKFKFAGIELMNVQPPVPRSSIMHIVASKRHIIPARSGIDIEVDVKHRNNYQRHLDGEPEEDNLALEATQLFNYKTGLHVAKALVSTTAINARNGKLICRLLNPSRKPVVIHRKTKIANLSPVDTIVEDPFAQHNLNDEAAVKLTEHWHGILEEMEKNAKVDDTGTTKVEPQATPIDLSSKSEPNFLLAPERFSPEPEFKSVPEQAIVVKLEGPFHEEINEAERVEEPFGISSLFSGINGDCLAIEAIPTPSTSTNTEPPAVKLGLSEISAKFDIGDDSLTPEERMQAEKVVNGNLDVFALSGKLGECTILPFSIETGDSKPLAVRNPRSNLLPARRQLEREGIQALKDQGLIRPSNSPWAAPVVLVRKSDGTWRFCVDYRQINNITKKDRFPLPRIEDCLSVMGGASWFSTLDLLSGYYQVRMEPTSVEKTAFLSNEGFFEFVRLPFGLCNAPSHFQRIMQIVCSGLQWNICLVFLDDIIIFSPTFEQHCKDLAIIFARLRQYGLTAKPSKCHLFKREVKFLGHIVCKDGVRQDPAKWAKMRSLPEPTSKDQLKSFMGLVEFYHKFVPNFSEIATPLYHLLGKRIRWNFTDECRASYNKLLHELYHNRILAFPDFNKPFRLAVDASQFACGAVLSQLNEEGLDRPISFASKVFGPNQRGYAAVVREAHGLAWAVEQFRPYILGAVDFVIFTDHQALTYLWKKKKQLPEGNRVGSAFALLGQYTLNLEHKPGKDNVVADAWSRIKAMTEDDVMALAKLNPPIVLAPEEIEELLRDARRAIEPIKPTPPENEKIVRLMNTDDRDEFIGVIGTSPAGFNDPALAESVTSGAVEKSTPPEPSFNSRHYLYQQIVDKWTPEINKDVKPGFVGRISFDQVAELEDLKAAQLTDEDIQFALLHGAEYRKNSRSPQFRTLSFLRRQLCRLSPYFIIHDQVVYLKTLPDQQSQVPQELLLVPGAMRNRVLHLAHDTPTSGHLGVKRTLARIRARFYWPSVARDVYDYCSSCVHCVSRKAPHIHRQQPMLPILAYTPFEKIGMDFKTVSQASTRGNQVILVVMDYFTKWVECYPLPTQSAMGVANCLIDFISRHGVPQHIISDQGAEFQADLFQQVCHLLQVDKRRTTPYRPQTDGQVERMNRVLDDLFSSLTADHVMPEVRYEF